MTTLVKIVVLALVVALLAPVVGVNTSLGQFVTAAIEDAQHFCERRPDACEQGSQFARDTGQLVTSALHRLTSETAADLTLEDLTLAPAVRRSEVPPMEASVPDGGLAEPEHFDP